MHSMSNGDYSIVRRVIVTVLALVAGMGAICSLWSAPPTAETGRKTASAAEGPLPSSPADRPNAETLTSLSVFPEDVVLVGRDRIQQLLVTGQFADGRLADLTGRAALRSVSPNVVQVLDGGVLQPVEDGQTEIVVEAEGRMVTVPVTVRETGQEQPINFTNEIVPIFGKLGCNGGGCHGKEAGQNGFKLSLMGFEPPVDYEAIVHDVRGRRVFPSTPERSLLLMKPTGRIGHGGGRRMEVGSPEYDLIARWIRSGMPYGSPDDPRVVRISITPEHRTLPLEAEQQVVVAAYYSDGSTEDVTRRAEYISIEPDMLTVSAQGRVKTQDLPGQGAVMARHLGHVAVFRATIPLGTPAETLPELPERNFVDRHVFARLRELGIPPSGICSDSEFLRRASLDIIGTLPTADEARAFLADSRPDKRERLVDDLLKRPEYSSYFALKWADLLRNRRGKDSQSGREADRTAAFHAWVRDSLAQNKPYDQFVREVVTATGEIGSRGNPPVAWFSQVRFPQEVVDDLTQLFLGTRIQCAQCHHHPYEKWSQDDYWSLAAFFSRMSWQDADGKELDTSRPERIGLVQRVVLKPDASPLRDPQRRDYDTPRVLDGEPAGLSADEDPRQTLMDWMVHPDNPFFAPALVNRYWAHFFGRGIVDPPDDMRVSNPPSNPALLDALAADFIEHRFDLRHVVRTICTSITYQLSSLPNEHNQRDRQNFARYAPRRLPTEVLLDAIDQVTGTPSRFVEPPPRDGSPRTLPTGTRAIELPDEAPTTTFLKVFQKPPRESACECERTSEFTLSQSLHLLNSQEMLDKLTADAGRPARLAASSRSDAANITEIYLSFFARLPAPAELRNLEEFLASKAAEGNSRRRTYEDIFLVLLNSQEFLFNY